MLIYHILPRSDWEQAISGGSGAYRAASLESEGFIHASTREQAAATANRYYRGQQGLALLVIDTDRVQPEVRFDPVIHEGVEMRFPHIYGPLNLDAVVNVFEFAPGPGGEFSFPSA